VLLYYSSALGYKLVFTTRSDIVTGGVPMAGIQEVFPCWRAPLAGLRKMGHVSRMGARIGNINGFFHSMFMHQRAKLARAIT